MTAADMKTLVERFYRQLWNQWDDDAVDQVISADFIFRGSLGTETVGCDGWRAYRDVIRTGSPDFHNQVIELIAQPGRAAARIECRGHHLGPLLGRAASGRRFAYPAAAFFTGANGVLTAAWVLGDLDRLRRQLA